MESVTPKLASIPPIMESDWVRQNNKSKNSGARPMPRIKEFDNIQLCEIEIAIFQQKILKTLVFVFWLCLTPFLEAVTLKLESGTAKLELTRFCP